MTCHNYNIDCAVHVSQVNKNQIFIPVSYIVTYVYFPNPLNISKILLFSSSNSSFVSTSSSYNSLAVFKSSKQLLRSKTAFSGEIPFPSFQSLGVGDVGGLIAFTIAVAASATALATPSFFLGLTVAVPVISGIFGGVV